MSQTPECRIFSTLLRTTHHFRPRQTARGHREPPMSTRMLKTLDSFRTCGRFRRTTNQPRLARHLALHPTAPTNLIFPNCTSVVYVAAKAVSRGAMSASVRTVRIWRIGVTTVFLVEPAQENWCLIAEASTGQCQRRSLMPRVMHRKQGMNAISDSTALGNSLTDFGRDLY
jgi:hypothetical protein